MHKQTGWGELRAGTQAGHTGLWEGAFELQLKTPPPLHSLPIPQTPRNHMAIYPLLGDTRIASLCQREKGRGLGRADLRDSLLSLCEEPPLHPQPRAAWKVKNL